MKKSKSDKRRTQALAPADNDATAYFELVFNDEEDTLSSGHVVLTHQCDMPALEEYLREMSEIDSRTGSAGLH